MNLFSDEMYRSDSTDPVVGSSELNTGSQARQAAQDKIVDLCQPCPHKSTHLGLSPLSHRQF